MATYTYTAVKERGERAAGTIDAQSESDAVGELRRQGLVVVSVSKGRGGKKSRGARSKGRESQGLFSTSLSKPKGRDVSKARVKSVEMVVFTRQLSTMISSGIPLVEAIEILGEQAEDAGFRGALVDVSESVRAGKDLSQALSNHPRLFPKIYINMVKAGEASGQLDIVLTRLAEYQEATEELKQEIKSAMTYPVISLTLVLGITVFLLIFIIPKFEEMFNSMKVDLPAITKALLALSLFLQEKVLIVAMGVVVTVVGILMYFKTDKGRYFADWLKLNIPIFGPLFSKVAISRFSRTLSTLIQSGVPILGALEIVSEACGNRIVSDAVNEASESVRQGETLGEPLANSGVFPPMVTKMIAIGEKSGALEHLLEKIADFYDQQVKTTVDSLTSLIEPLMIGVMGFFVGGMVLAIFLPVFKMVGSLGG